MSPLIPSNWKVPEVFHTRLGEQAGRQRTMESDGHLLVVLHKVPVPGDADRHAMLFWRDPAGVWRGTGSGSGVAEISAYTGEFVRAVDRLESQIAKPPSSDNYFQILHEATPMLRTVRNMHRAWQEARDKAPNDRNILLARDQAGELERSLELLTSDAQHGLDYMVARQAEEQARASQRLVESGHRLNLLVAIFLPLTAIASLFGMNLRHGFEEVNSPLLFWVILVVSILLGLIVKAVISVPAAQVSRTGPSVGSGGASPVSQNPGAARSTGPGRPG